MRLFKKLLLSAAAMAVTTLLCMVCAGAEKSGFWTYEVEDSEWRDYYGRALITGYSGFGDVLSIPDTIDGIKVYGIGDGAFNDNKNIGIVIIPEGIEYIGSQAFMDSSIKEVYLPSSLNDWNCRGWGTLYETFSDCANLSNVYCGMGNFPGSSDAFSNISENVVINCIAGSPAEEYAKENNFSYKTSIKAIPVTSLKTNKSNYTLKVGERLQIAPSVSPINTTDKLTWTSGDTDVATVSNSGEIYGKQEGLVAIRVEASSGVKADFTVNVT